MSNFIFVFNLDFRFRFDFFFSLNVFINNFFVSLSLNFSGQSLQQKRGKTIIAKSTVAYFQYKNAQYFICIKSVEREKTKNGNTSPQKLHRNEKENCVARTSQTLYFSFNFEFFHIIGCVLLFFFFFSSQHSFWFAPKRNTHNWFACAEVSVNSFRTENQKKKTKPKQKINVYTKTEPFAERDQNGYNHKNKYN